MLYRTSIAPFFSLRRDIDRLFEDVLGRDAEGRAWAPAVDVRESEDALMLELELPGVSPENVEVTAENGVLTIRGEKRSERKEGDEKERWHMVERSYGSFRRAFQLPQGVDEDQIEASFEHGVLTVRVPKAALPQPRRIQVRSASSGQRQVSSASRNREGARDDSRAANGASRETGRERAREESTAR